MHVFGKYVDLMHYGVTGACGLAGAGVLPWKPVPLQHFAVSLYTEAHPLSVPRNAPPPRGPAATGDMLGQPLWVWVWGWG